MKQEVRITDLSRAGAILSQHIEESSYRRLIIIADQNTEEHCLRRLNDGSSMPEIWYTAPVIIVPAGEGCKDISVVTDVWRQLSELPAHRDTCLCALGGGALTDMAGFVAATYKRGTGLINIPTTLLGAVDAAIGGKTGIDLEGVKNIIGAFYPASLTLICPQLFESLPASELLSGYGEVLKYALLVGKPLFSEVLSRRAGDTTPDILRACIEHKQRIVAEDPFDQGVRMTLNLGHTVAHALEGLMVRRQRPPIAHGIAVTAGIIVELYLSVKRCGLDRNTLYSIAGYIRDEFPRAAFTCHDYGILMEIMRQDKKNTGDHITCILLAEPGSPLIVRDITSKEIEEALDFYRDFVGI
ncbi:3-dehydroquinate synthase family protein [Porphyromonas sp.]|uniref:3-dehydroquinate synthase n=1 Tax=Porphyromonas sp. TaxID=1924944 RepID=UPI0026DAF680|nr:3-dehydroquinate synthase family protein [Porphyromonas sp.]MDO4771450.1 3-dehydroquinate synthase family protein [Porphyromonas sp.]